MQVFKKLDQAIGYFQCMSFRSLWTVNCYWLSSSQVEKRNLHLTEVQLDKKKNSFLSAQLVSVAVFEECMYVQKWRCITE